MSSPPSENGPMDADLTWSLRPTPDGQALRVEYAVANRGTTPIFCLDRMTPFVGDAAADADRTIIALPSPDGARLWLVRGFYPHPYATVLAPWLPGVRVIEAGASVSGAATVPLPLRAWHPGTGETPLRADPTEAVLQIGVAPRSLPLEEMTLPDGRAIRRPVFATAADFQRLLASTSLPLPV